MHKSAKYSALAFLLFITSAISSKAFTDNYPKNPKIDAINYAFAIELSDNTDEIFCDLTASIRFPGAGVEVLRLDLIKKADALNGKGMEVTEVSAQGVKLSFIHENDALLINLPAPSKADELKTFIIKYHGIPATGLKIANNKYGDRTFFSDNWPDKGRNWLATIDHPYDKAMCEFIITAPNHYQVVSNGLKVEESNLDNGMKLTHWKQSVPIAPWLYVLGAAEFAVQYVDTFDGKSIETWVYKQDREKGFYDFAEPTKKVVEYYSSYVGPFAYERLANIQSNSVSGGMEAASAILYSENSVVGDRNERWRNVVIHEIAHQWFGNAVTEYDWDDVWLSEGFATYFTLLFIEHEYGRDAFIDGLEKSQQRVNDFYKKNPEYIIVHDNLKDMSQVTSSQTYQKGSWILHMLRGVIGTDNFWRGIQSYYKTYYNKNATTANFQQAMEETSGMDLAWFFQQWLYEPGTLNYSGEWKFNPKKNKVELKLSQTQQDKQYFKMPIEVGIYYQDGSAPQIEKVRMDEQSKQFEFDVPKKPTSVVLDPNKWVLMKSIITEKK